MYVRRQTKGLDDRRGCGLMLLQYFRVALARCHFIAITEEAKGTEYRLG